MEKKEASPLVKGAECPVTIGRDGVQGKPRWQADKVGSDENLRG